ncbi:coiled-coil domain-containing protein 103 [Cololabis saira]|uniref:coiled-coil domain-containing protein 103 n=1 Tax=Cololabis saira TaxID=129043 RepID=UPI002AD3F1C6|nr:coiled-coil domain-containing protein 103 [Cololabis saira]XP_061568357.1 coiled-coil domain-containing protein 103 [Cololabis saira]
MSQRDVIDFAALEAELQTAVQNQQKYERENETKLRAVRQGVSYEEFRNLVLASNLKPLDRKDKHGGSRKQPWNPVAPATAPATAPPPQSDVITGSDVINR